MSDIHFIVTMFFLSISALCMILTLVMIFWSLILRKKKHPDRDKIDALKTIAIYCGNIGSMCLLLAFIFLFIG